MSWDRSSHCKVKERRGVASVVQSTIVVSASSGSRRISRIRIHDQTTDPWKRRSMMIRSGRNCLIPVRLVRSRCKVRRIGSAQRASRKSARISTHSSITRTWGYADSSGTSGAAFIVVRAWQHRRWMHIRTPPEFFRVASRNSFGMWPETDCALPGSAGDLRQVGHGPALFPNVPR